MALGRAELSAEEPRDWHGDLLAVLPVAPYTGQTAHEHARIWAQLAAAGTRIGAHDLIVASTALERGSAVATFSRPRFDCVP